MKNLINKYQNDQNFGNESILITQEKEKESFETDKIVSINNVNQSEHQAPPPRPVPLLDLAKTEPKPPKIEKAGGSDSM